MNSATLFLYRVLILLFNFQYSFCLPLVGYSNGITVKLNRWIIYYCLTGIFSSALKLGECTAARKLTVNKHDKVWIIRLCSCKGSNFGLQYISNKMQRYTVYLYLENCSTCFGCYFHPLSEAHTTVSTASGICHNVTAFCPYRGRIGNGLSVLWVACATHSTLKPVPTLPR